MAPLPTVKKAGIDILFPSQYQTLIDNARDDRFRDTLTILFHTGMRYSELKQISRETYDERSGKLCIRSEKALCKGKGKTEKTKERFRWITLTPQARSSVVRWISQGFKPMSLQAYNERVAKIARYHGFTVSGKTSRKTLESWRLILGDDSVKTCVEIGHSPATAYNHYLQNLPFIDEDLQMIRQVLGRV